MHGDLVVLALANVEVMLIQTHSYKLLQNNLKVPKVAADCPIVGRIHLRTL